MTIAIGRRQFVSTLGGAAVCAIGATHTRAQTTPKPLRVGFVHPVSPKGVPPNYVEFIGRLRELGYVEGDTLAVEYINLEGHPERYDESMRELVRRRVDLIYALGQEENLRAAMAATSTIPIVMLAISYDPLAKGYVSSLARPTGNVTGITVLGVELIKKRLQLFKDAFPERHAAFGFWDFESDETWRIATAAAPSLGITLAGVKVGGTPYDYDGGFQQVAPEFRGALFMANSAIFVRDAERLAAFALQHRMVSCFDSSPIYVEAGGTHVVRRRPRRGGAARGRVRRPDRARRETFGPAGRAIDPVHATDQPQGRKDPRHYLLAHLPRDRRRRDRVTDGKPS